MPKARASGAAGAGPYGGRGTFAEERGRVRMRPGRVLLPGVGLTAEVLRYGRDILPGPTNVNSGLVLLA